ncbi:MAG: HlyD family efflux transporter periplasmic adaptor subunit [Planctomycetaceae bacterium]
MAIDDSSTVQFRAAAMLQQAERRCSSPDDAFQLLAALTREISDLPECSAVTVWDVRPGSRAPLLTMGGDGRPLAIAQSTGVRLDEEPYETESGSDVRATLISSADVVPKVQIVLAVSAADAMPADPMSTDLLQMLADVIADLYRRELLSRMLQMSDRYSGILNLVTAMNDGLDRNRVMTVFATDGAAVLRADRVSVAVRESRGNWQLSSSTGVTDPEHRSDAVRALRRLVEQAASAATGSTDSGIDGGEASGDSATLVRPLSRDANWATADAAAVIEFGRVPAASDTATADILCRHVAEALENCRRVENLRPTVRLRNAIGQVFARRALAVTLLLGLPLLWLLFGTATLRIEAYGTTIPVGRQFVFAPEGGVITEVVVADHQVVGQGDVLCRIRNDELEILQERLQGDLSAARTRLAALESLPRSSVAASNSGLPISAEKEELKQRVLGLEQQKSIVDAQVETLVVRSPIPGTVHRERIAESLTGRPVQKGQLLLEVADETGPWELQLRIPESDIRHVFAAQATATQSLPVTFVLETSPQNVHHTTLTSVAESTELDETGRLATLATAELPAAATRDHLRPGSGVVARVDCGPARAGFVYFRRVIEFLERRLLL